VSKRKKREGYSLTKRMLKKAEAERKSFIKTQLLVGYFNVFKEPQLFI